MRKPRVVVAGMGDTGVLVATHLGRSVDVVGVATKPALVSGQELGNRLASPDAWRRNYLTPFGRFRRLDRVATVHGAISRVDTANRLVHVEGADGNHTVVRYDLLVIASGVTNGFWRQNQVQDLDAIEEGLDQVSKEIEAAEQIAIVGGGATGVSAAANLARRHPTKQVHLFFSRDEPLPDYHPKVRRHITRELEGAGVHLHPDHRAAMPEGLRTDRLTTDPIAWSTGQAPFSADLVLWATGQVRPNSGYLPPDIVDDDGFVRVDQHLRVPGHPDVFAIGDIAASDPNRCSARNFGYRIVVHNIKAILRGRQGRLKTFEPPEYRWGSILGIQDDGMVVYQPNGSRFRVPRWAVQPVLFDAFTKAGMYGGVRRPPSRS